MVQGQEYMAQMSMLDQRAQKLQEQIQAVNQQIQEFEDLKSSLDDLSKTDEKEILSPVGKGVFFKSELKDKKLFVNVGSDIVVKRKPKDAMKIVDKQIGQLEDVKKTLMGEGEKIQKEFQKIIMNAQQAKK